MIEFISKDREKDVIYIIFKRSDIKSIQIELIKNIEDKAK